MGFVVSLILIGLVLIFAEILIIPGVGVAGILGLLSMGGSCYYAFYEFGSTTGGIVTGVNGLLHFCAQGKDLEEVHSGYAYRFKGCIFGSCPCRR